MAAAEAAAAALLERLEALPCPPVLPRPPPVAPPAALALLCQPSGQRRALLEWACARVHPPLAARLESLPEDARMREMAKLGAQLMLCGDDDIALVEGTAPPEQQLQFLQDLLDAAPPPREPPKNRKVSRTVRFLQELLQSPAGGAALRPPEPPPGPPGSPPRARRPLPQLEEELGRVQHSLQQIQAQLSALGGSPPPSPPDLGVPGGALASSLAAFGASDLREPPGPPGDPPQIHPCGPRAPPVGRGLRQLRQVLGSLAQLRLSVGEVTRLGGLSEAIAPQLPPISHRFQPPPD